MLTKGQTIIAIILCCICLIIGGFLLFLGIRNTVTVEKKLDCYSSTDATYIGCMLYSEGNNRKNQSSTYALTYLYTVNGTDYTITTDYGTAAIPELGSKREIFYDPADPEDAILSGTGKHSVLLLVGLMFILIPLCMVIGLLSANGIIPTGRISIFEVGIGLVFVILGFAILYVMGGSLSPVTAFQAVGFIALIPILFIAVGLLQTVKSLRKKNE